MKNETGPHVDRVGAWLKEHAVTFSIKRTGEQFGFDNGQEEPKLWHDVYTATFTREGQRPLVIESFKQSAAHSESGARRNTVGPRSQFGVQFSPEIPSAYSILSCIEKNDPDTFESFCGDMGYDTDSRRALETYLAVQAEFAKVRAFFSPEELEELCEVAQ